MSKGDLMTDVRAIEAEEDLLIDIQFLIEEITQRKGVTRAELARRTGLSKARISQLLSAEANPTVKSVARVFHALGERLHVATASPKRVKPIADVWDKPKEETHAPGFDSERLLAIAAIRKRAVLNDNHLKAKSSDELKNEA